MANLNLALKENVEGNFFVDSTCIDCGACRHFSPENFGALGTASYVQKQPENEAEILTSKQALLACPVGCIGTSEKTELKSAINSLPREMAENIFINGFNHENSFGAHSYFIRSEDGNWLADSPRFTKHLIKQFEELGGIKYIWLSHRDDVADAKKYAEHFGAKRIIHKFDSKAQPDAEIILESDDFTSFKNAKIFYVPGHTKGHLTLLWKDEFLFTGDHFAWLTNKKMFGSFRTACWYSWEEQIKSIERLKVCEKVEHVFPGHGMWGEIEEGKFPEVIEKAVNWMISIK